MVNLQNIGTQKSDRVSQITDSSWSQYMNLEIPSSLISFRNGVITIVSPGRNHEILGDLVRAIIWFYCRQINLPFFTFNQTRLKVEGKEGKEPDVAYCFGEDKEQPDLAVEINLTSGSVDDLTKYRYLNVPEVWLWDSGRIRFFLYRSEGYMEVTASRFLPGLKCDRLSEIINQSFGKTPLEIEAILQENNG
jgi:Uma2 family endonuclease